MRLFLCGDVMIGRGIDQILPHPCDPRVYESYVTSATEYVELAERASGPIPRIVSPKYIWGTALSEFEQMRPDVRIINLETSVTRNNEYQPKGINYRVSPENAECLRTGGIDCCVLANNHVLDWGAQGLLDTLTTLEHLHISVAGAGRDGAQASAPAILRVPGQGRVLVFSYALPTSGVPSVWAAKEKSPGINLLPDLSQTCVARVANEVARARQRDDVAIVSLHWGPNWGYEIPNDHVAFAHALIDQAGPSVIHGHSSHHPKAVEVYRNRLILYGCGDFINDYEGISGYEEFRGDLALMYFADVEASSAELTGLEMLPLRMHRFQLDRVSATDAEQLRDVLERECARFGVSIELISSRLKATWKSDHEHLGLK
jgi:poly-gamma-glutamate synthesis protein (capsule biosynthesis protein)